MELILDGLNCPSPGQKNDSEKCEKSKLSKYKIDVHISRGPGKVHIFTHPMCAPRQRKCRGATRRTMRTHGRTMQGSGTHCTNCTVNTRKCNRCRATRPQTTRDPGWLRWACLRGGAVANAPVRLPRYPKSWYPLPVQHGSAAPRAQGTHNHRVPGTRQHRRARTHDVRLGVPTALAPSVPGSRVVLGWTPWPGTGA